MKNQLSRKHAAIIAAIGLLLMAIFAPVGNFLAVQNMIVADDTAATISNILESEGLFRFGIVSFIIVAILDIIVAWALYVFLKPIHKELSLLAGWFRILYGAILGALLVHLLNVLTLVGESSFLSTMGPGQLGSHVMLSLESFNRGWSLSLVLFSIHLLLIGYLIFKAGYMKKILGFLLLLAGLGYLVDGIGNVLFSGYSIEMALYTFIGEVVLIFWLLIAGRKLPEEEG